MVNLSDFAPFVKVQAKRARRIASRYQPDDHRRDKSLQTAEQFDRLASALEEAADGAVTPRNTSTEARRSFALTPTDLKDLPEELVSQLQLSDSDRQELEILEVFEKEGGVLSLDLALIGLYRHTGDVWDRSKLNAKLYRMHRKGQLHSVPNKKGVYSIWPGSESEDGTVPEESDLEE